MDKMINKICKHLPTGWEMALFMENGSAYVSLTDPSGRFPGLPDATDKSLIEQLNDALCIANGWNEIT